MVQPGEKFVPLNVGDKLLFPLREQLQPISWFPTFASAGWSHLIDGHPKYGTNSAAFGQRLGAAAIRDLSMRTFSDGLLPALLHEDPRYFRMGSGSIPRRGWYAASCVFIGRRDSGATGFNSSVLIGHGMASALTMAYYPDESAKTHVVFQTWGTSLAGEAGGNLWDEFWPDVRNKLFRRHRDPQP
ncbi:MAG TPA: hypothetical protein VHT24_11760 [Pseudacidobacterium sp.]|nr:hypothetical protein [Pseudacidobacterium sp.]